jgi:hypothetical protein
MKSIIITLCLFFSAFGLFAQSLPNGAVIALQADTDKWVARCNGCQNAAVNNTATIHVSANTAKELPAYAKFTVVDMKNGKVALKADNGMYLTRCRSCVTGGPADVITVHVDNPNAGYAQFTPVSMGNGKFAFKTDTGKYMARCRNCSPGATTNDILSNHVDNPNAAYAQFKVEILSAPLPRPFVDGRQVALQADTKKWVARCNNCQNAAVKNTATIHVNANSIRELPAYAKFTVVDMKNGKVAFKADNGMYLTRCRGCVSGGPADVITVHVSDPSAAYAQFTPVSMGNGKFAFKTDTGKYIARCRNCSPGASTNDILSNHVDNPNAAYAQFIVRPIKTAQDRVLQPHARQ